MVARLATLLVLGLLPGALLALRPASEAPVESPPDRYVGPQACRECHAERVDQVLASNHASSWRPTSDLENLGLGPQRIQVDGIRYSVDRQDGRWVYGIELPGRPRQTFPIHSLMGGKRLGLAMILSVDRLEGRRLSRPALVEARYMFGTEEPVFRLAPGFPEEKADGYGNAIGHVLSPVMVEKCFSCHGGIQDTELARAGGPHPQRVVSGVTCESCHGPAAAHVEAARAQRADLEIIHPGKLPIPQLHQRCAACHSGFFPRQQPRPVDLEVANQLTALVNSECYIKSGQGVSCLTCHDPHSNARPRGAYYDTICQDCHAAARPAQVACPVNPRSDCVNCHMPEIVLPEDFHMTDHWIRVVEKPSDSRLRAFQIEERALDLIDEGRLEPAVTLLQESLQLYPDFIHGHLTLGNAYNGLGEFEKEEQSYRRAIRIAPDFYQAYHDLGALLFSRSDPVGALEAFHRAVEIRPDLPRTYVNLSTLYGGLGMRGEAIRAAQQAIENDPLLPSAHYVLGAARREEDLEVALKSFETAAFLAPREPGFQLTVASSLWQLGRVAEARRVLESLRREFPEFDEARAALEELNRRQEGSR